jgi:hypothetical protein
LTRKVFWTWNIAITFCSFLLRFLIGPNPSYGAGHDDELMVRTANFLASGQWAGPYDQIGQVGLSKPIGYPLFLYVTHWIPFSPVEIVHLLILAGILFVFKELTFFGISRRLSVFLYLIFAFYPALFNESISRIYRDGFLAALTVWLLGLSLMSRRRSLQTTTSYRKRFSVIWIGFLIGLTFGVFLITKNTWHYIFALVLGILLIPCPKDGLKVELKKWLSATAIAVAPIILGVMLILFFVTTNNSKNYGVRLIDTYSYGSFPAAMKSIYAVKDSQDRPFLDVTKEMRAVIYEVSPTFSALKQHLELPDNEGWRGASCASSMAICDESAAWFPWDLREAVQKAGLGDTAVEFEKTFSKIQSDIDNACTEKKIACESKGLAPGLDSLDSLSPRIAINAFMYGTSELLKPGSGFATRAVSTNANITNDQIMLWNKVVNRLPISKFSSQYEVRAVFMTDVRQLLIKIYETFWIPLVLLAMLGYLLSYRRNWQIFTISSVLLASISILILELSLLEASSGVYMIPGSELYLICLIPLVFAFIALGLTQVIQHGRAFLSR